MAETPAASPASAAPTETPKEPAKAAGKGAAPPAVPPGGTPPEGGEEAPPPDKLVQRQAQLTRQFAALSKREKELEKRTKAEREQFEQERQIYAAERQQFLEARKRAAADPDAWLRAGGLSYDKVTDFYTKRQANPGAQAPDEGWRKEIDERFEKFDKSFKEREDKLLQQQNEYVKSKDIDTIKTFANAEAETFELVNQYEAWGDVYDYLRLHLEEHGTMADLKSACERIEEVLLEQEETRVKKALGSKKLAARVGWAPQDKSQPGEDEAEAESESPKKQVTTPARGNPKKTSAPPASRRRPSEDTLPKDPDERWEAILRRETRGR